MHNPNKVPTTKRICLVYSQPISNLDMTLEALIEYLQGFLEKIPEQDRHTAGLDYERGYYDEPDTYNITYIHTLSQREIDEANARVERRKSEIEAKKKHEAINTRAREMRELRRLEKKYRTKN